MRSIASMPPVLTDEAADVDGLWDVFFAIAVGVFLLVAFLLVWCMLRYRRRDDRLPKQVRHHTVTELAYTITPFLIVVGLFAGTYTTVRAIERRDEPDLVVEVTGFQWQWRFTYPDQGVSITGAGEHEPELVLPADSTVRFELTSTDVIHSFWIPGFRYKLDVFPGQTTEFDVAIRDRTGTWADGACAEFCGLDHATMRFVVTIVDPDEFEARLDEVAAATAERTGT